MSEHRCEGQVSDYNVGWPSFSNCGRRAKVEVDGKWYCGIHDPEKAKARRAAKIAEWRNSSAASESRLRVAQRVAHEVNDLVGGDARAEWLDFKRGYSGAIIVQIAELEKLIKLAQKARRDEST